MRRLLFLQPHILFISSAVVLLVVSFLYIPSIAINKQQVDAGVSDIGIWVDQNGGQVAGTSFGDFEFEGTGSEVRNDGGYSYNTGQNGVRLGDPGNYLALYYLHFEDANVNRGNVEARVIHDGVALPGSYGAGFKRNDLNQQIYVRGHALILNAANNDLVKVEYQRDTDVNVGSSVAGVSELMIVRLPDDTEAAYASYSSLSTDSFGGTSWNSVPFTTTERETDSSVIESVSITPEHATVLGNIGHDGTDGHFPVLFGNNPSYAGVVSMLTDEDEIVDTERNHTAEDIGYMAFDTASGVIHNSVGADIGEWGIVRDVNGTTTVSLENTYTNPVIVTTYNLLAATDVPSVVRITATTSSSFDLKLQNPGDGATPVVSDVHYTVVEAGLHTLPGGDAIEAGTMSVNGAASNATSWTADLEQVTLSGSYTNITAITQIMDFAETKWVSAWASNGTQAGTPTPADFYVGQHVAQDTDRVRSTSTIGWIVAERGTGTTNDVNWDFGITADVIQGPDDSPPDTHSLTGMTTGISSKILLKPADTRFLVLYGLSFDIGGARSQRISRAIIDGLEIAGSSGYAYTRNNNNSLGAPIGMFIYETSSSNEELFIQAQRGLADDDGTGGLQSGNSGIFIMELPNYTDVIVADDATGGQDVSGVTIDINAIRSVGAQDLDSFAKEDNATVRAVKNMDILAAASCRIERTGTSGTRATVGSRFEIEGVDQPRGEHGFYLRGNQSTTDTYNGSVNSAGIYSVVTDDSLQFELYDDGDNGSTDNTVGGTCGLSAINLDTLLEPSFPPTMSTVTIDGGASGITLVENSTTTVSCVGTATDLDGFADISFVTADLYRSNYATTSPLSNDRYYQRSGDSACVPSGGSGNSETYTCDFEVFYYADATDAGSQHEATDWTCTMTPHDASDQGSADSDTIEMNSLVALDVLETINYGSLDAGLNSGAVNSTTTVINTGNRSIDIDLNGTDMSSGGSSIGVTNQQYNDVAFTYGSGTTLTSSAATFTLDLPAPVATTTSVSDLVYWGIAIPGSTESGTYTGTNTFTAVAD